MTETRRELRQKLQNKLRELFQFDVSDLDFGIYRILNRKRDEIEKFIEVKLIDAIGEGLEEYAQVDTSKVEELRNQIKSTLSEDAFDEEGNLTEYQDTKLGIEYQATVAEAEKAEVGEEIEKRIYNDLIHFFSRYYDDGDFLTQRRISTRDSKYAVPYNGEEVMLHWANKDQYYIKTGEQFTDYKFEVDDFTVWFKLKQAETEKDNVKESDTRYFVLRPDNPIELDEENNTLTLWFEYRVLTEDEEEHWLSISNEVEGKKLKTLSRQQLCIAFDDWVRKELPGQWRTALSVIPENKDRSLLYQKLNHYTGKNTTDYFIHKNLQNFLERELEYYLKHEVIQVDDFIEAESTQPMQTALTRAKVVRDIGKKIIAFLSQIENFQKKLFEKKKFVVDTHYCFTLDMVPSELYAEITANEDQINEWKELYQIEKWDDDLFSNGDIDEGFLKNHPYMMLDTKFFSQEFTYRLLATFEELDENLGGLLFSSENFQALNLMQKKYQDKIKCTYIDPPYNTGDSEILYKNSYLNSSWITLLENRITNSIGLLEDDSIYFIAIDDFEYANLAKYLDSIYHEFRREVIVINHHPQGGKAKTLSNTHEYMIVLVDKSSDRTLTGRKVKDGKEFRPFKRSGTAESNFRYGRPNSFYAILVDDSTKNVVGIEEPPPLEDSYPKEKNTDGFVRVYPLGADGTERVWRRSYESCIKLIEEQKLFCSENNTIYHVIEAEDRNPALFSNWIGKRYNAGTYGANLLRDIIGEQNPFSYPKSIYTVEDAIFSTDESESIFLDFFAGSGTTGHAVLNLNREDEGTRKYILVEMGKYFDTVLKPRLQKVVFSENWKDGVPQDKNGQSHAFKYHFIESYEDALNNIDFRDRDDTQEALKFDDYVMKYMLDFETQDVSPALLTNGAFETPFDYALKIQRGHESPKPETVDLVVTFHYLIGLWVQTLRRYEHQERPYVISTGEIRGEDKIETVLVVWRNVVDLDLDAEAEWIQEHFIDDEMFDRIYINGKNKVPAAQPTEITFREQMFETVT